MTNELHADSIEFDPISSHEFKMTYWQGSTMTATYVSLAYKRLVEESRATIAELKDRERVALEQYTNTHYAAMVLGREASESKATLATLTAERDELRRGLRLALVYMDDDIQQMFDMERHGISTNVESVNNQAYEFDRLAKLIGFKSKYHPRMKAAQLKEQDDE